MILVTGGCGFIGSHLVRALLARNERVLVIDSLRYGSMGNLGLNTGRGNPGKENPGKGNPGTENLGMELLASCDDSFAESFSDSLAESLPDPVVASVGESTDKQFGASVSDSQLEIIRFTLGKDSPEAISHKLREVRQVYHLAAEKHNQSKDRPSDVFRANVEGMHDLLDVLVNLNLEKVVYTSSLYAYGRMQEPATSETDALEPDTIYGISKTAGEHMLRYFERNYKLSSNTLRLYFIYGPRQFAGMGYKSVIVKSFERILKGQAPVIYGDGLQALDYVFIDDAVEALLLAMESDISGQTFNISSGKAVCVKDLVEQMIHVAGADQKPEYGPADWTHGSYRVGNPEKARQLLGWQARTGLLQGLASTYEWIKGG